MGAVVGVIVGAVLVWGLVVLVRAGNLAGTEMEVEIAAALRCEATIHSWTDRTTSQETGHGIAGGGLVGGDRRTFDLTVHHPTGDYSATVRWEVLKGRIEVTNEMHIPVRVIEGRQALVVPDIDGLRMPPEEYAAIRYARAG